MITHDNKQYYCTMCKFKTIRPDTFRRHLKDHTRFAEQNSDATELNQLTQVYFIWLTLIGFISEALLLWDKKWSKTLEDNEKASSYHFTFPIKSYSLRINSSKDLSFYLGFNSWNYYRGPVRHERWHQSCLWKVIRTEKKRTIHSAHNYQELLIQFI